MYPDLPSMNPQKFRRLQSNFVRFGSRHTERTLTRPITSNEDNEINVLAYFYANPQSFDSFSGSGFEHFLQFHSEDFTES